MQAQFNFSFGSEVYTWYMSNSGNTYQGKLGHMTEVISRAGFTGIQPIFSWMGEYTDAVRFKSKLAEENLELAAISLALEWNGTTETAEEKAIANEAISFLQHFPGAILCMVQLPTSRHHLEERRLKLVNILHEVASRAQQKGIPCSFHPNSPHSSITRTEEDYTVLLELLNPALVGWTPDVGHMINAGMDPLQKMQQYQHLINLVHYKDWSGEPEFALMGSGKVDLFSITQWLKSINYKGWIICEDEGVEALENPDAVTMHDGKWIRESLIPALL